MRPRQYELGFMKAIQTPYRQQHLNRLIVWAAGDPGQQFFLVLCNQFMRIAELGPFLHHLLLVREKERHIRNQRQQRIQTVHAQRAAEDLERQRRLDRPRDPRLDLQNQRLRLVPAEGNPVEGAATPVATTAAAAEAGNTEGGENNEEAADDADNAEAGGGGGENGPDEAAEAGRRHYDKSLTRT